MKFFLKCLYLMYFVIVQSTCAFAQMFSTEKVDDKVKELLSMMTIEEKIGQMTQITLQVVSKTQGTKDQQHEIDDVKLKEAINKYHIGSILNVYDVAFSVDYWNSLITKIQDIATKETRLGIPVIYGIDAIHGTTYTRGATLFPQAMNMAATWNTDLVKKCGEITSLETKASGIAWNFYPVMDIGRQPIWPRLWETYGEDVYLATKMGEAYIYGAQGNNIGAADKLGTCLKHYVGYSYPLNGVDRTPAWITERTLREYFLPTFEAGIKAGAPTIMVNSGEVDGIPGHANYHLLTEILRHELNFKGFVVSDWGDIKHLYTREKIASSPKEAVKIAVMAGVDMSMVPDDYSFYDLLLELVKEGEVPLWRIDEAVGRILAVKMQLGLFDDPYPKKDLAKQFANSEFTKSNLQAAHESIVLTRNENNILPLSKNSKILVTGPTANLLSVMNGGWTITWQGNEESLYPQEKNTVLEAIQNKIGTGNVNYVEGVGFNQEINIAQVVNEATKSDAIIVCLGEPTYCEVPGNISDLKLNQAQLNLVTEISKTGKPVILVMLEGRPRVITDIVEKTSAVVLGFLPGMEGGNAIADILFGDANPSGKLSITYPKYVNGFTNYDYKTQENFEGNKFDPMWPFGYGMSYSTFEYSNLRLNTNEITTNEQLEISIDVKNTGKLTGKEVVQLYISDLYGSVTRPNKQLKGFEKIELKPGETKKVNFTIDKTHLSFIGLENKRIVETGDFLVTIGDNSAKFTLK